MNISKKMILLKTRKASLYLFILSFGLLSSIQAQTKEDTDKTITKIIIVKDNPVVAMLDSLSNKKFQKYSEQIPNNTVHKFTPDFVPSFSDSVYTMRIAKLNAKSPFGLRYNEDVKTFINLYAFKKRYLTSRMLGLAQLYFPLFEEQLDKYKLPLELKYLAVVESALNPEARSWAGASGLWQFIYPTGKLYGLKVTSYVDERCDPLKATIAACQHFKDLFAIYQDWSLVLAAYNSGPGNVNKAIRKANGEMNFWKIMQYLPRETQSYVPAFIAVTYVMNYAPEHNIFPIVPKIVYEDVDTLKIYQQLELAQVAEYLNIPIEDITFLNPSFFKGVIPATNEEPYFLRLPKKYIGDFLNNEKSIYAYKTKAQIKQEDLQALKKKEIQDKLDKKNKNSTEKKDVGVDEKVVQNTNVNEKSNSKYYIVCKGDGLGTIAYKHNCKVKQLQEWNGLKNMNIYPGQKLILQPPQNTSTTNNSINENKNEVVNQPTTTYAEAKNKKYIYHTVQKGDSLWGIANKYKGVTVQQIKKLNNLGDKYNLYPGQKLKISLAS